MSPGRYRLDQDSRCATRVTTSVSRAESTWIDLGQDTGGVTDFYHLCFAVADLEKAMEDLTNAGGIE